jgi:hypothetical protein
VSEPYGRGRPFDLRILGQSQVPAGSKGSLRIVAFDPVTGNPMRDVPVNVSLESRASVQPNASPRQSDSPERGAPAKSNASPEQGAPVAQGVSPERSAPAGRKALDGKKKIAAGRTDGTGTILAQFESPAEEGSAVLDLAAGDGPYKYERPISLSVVRKTKIYLTTDKPLYQPGQTMHIRALCLDDHSLAAQGGKELILHVEDSKGNKVFKKKLKTSRFGIASAKFELADEVNTGEYHVKALLDKESQEKSVTVKKYVLPKFKIELTKDRSFYAPGDTIKGSLKADYFFGKPVAGAEVTLILSTFETGFRKAGEIKGKTDREGSFSFELRIPSYLVGQPLEKGKAVAKIDAQVTDTARHKETKSVPVTVTSRPISIDIMPESGTLRSGLSNNVYILTSYPDGSPCKANLTIKHDSVETAAVTDAAGFTSVTMDCPEGKSVSVTVQAFDEKGARSSISTELRPEAGEDSIILRTDKPSYRVGQSMNLDVLSVKKNVAVYLDCIRGGQTALTKTFDVGALGRGKLSMSLTPDLSGVIQLRAYRITSRGDTVRDTRTVYVEPANALKITAKADKEEYKPGEPSRIDFNVATVSGRPTAAALGVDIVDESVFALGELTPGLERVYFLLEKELMEPKYEIHGTTITSVILDGRKPEEEGVRRALFQKVPAGEYSLNINTYTERLTALHAKFQKICGAYYSFHAKHRRFPTDLDWDTMVSENLLTKEDTLDPWGTRFSLRMVRRGGAPVITSAGPDRKEGTDDDIIFENYALRDGKGRPIQGGQVFGGPRDIFVMEGAGRGIMARQDMAVEKAMPVPSAAPQTSIAKQAPAAAGEKQPAKVREYFPETLYTNPEVICDEEGRGFITLDMADSITTWRLSAFGNSMRGEMGNLTMGLKVFQDFFIDIDLPVALTQNDKVSIPVAVYNYLPEAQDVRVKIEKAEWFALSGSEEQRIHLEKNEVSVVHFPIEVMKLGWHKMTVWGYGARMSDAQRREIEVVPNGKEILVTKSDRLSSRVTALVEIPEGAIPDSAKILVTIYPGILSQIVDGMDKILRMPFGCFEQTSSSTYPNILVLDYLKKINKITPEIQMKAEGYINTGYQRLLSFECQGGGFSWFGNVPANKILTAFGAMEFNDMAAVYDVDGNVIRRTQQWLMAQQGQDGAWSPDQSYLHEESWGKIQNNKIPVTAYIAWALLESGSKDAGLKRAASYLRTNFGQARDPYALALVCNALVIDGPDDEGTKKALEELAKMAQRDKDSAHWSAGMSTAVYSHGASADVETTALAVLAFLRAKGFETLANEGLTWLIRNKDPYGTWHSTQGTILAMKALVLSSIKAGEKVSADVTATVNGKGKKEFKITPDDFDVYRLADFKAETVMGRNTVDLTFQGNGSCYYQVTAKYFVPWTAVKAPAGPIAIDVNYDRTSIEQDDMVKVTVKAGNTTSGTLNMVMLDLGIPPGFTLQHEDLQQYVGKAVKKYTATGRQIIVYLESLGPGQTLALSYRVKARFPMRAKTPQSRAYLYYTPEAQSVAKPVSLEVRGKR